MGTVLTILIGGLIIGALGKWVAPGDRDHVPLWLTLVCGIGGMLIGTWVYGVIWNNTDTPGFDWWRHAWQVAVAAVLVVLAAGATGRNRPRV